MPARPRRLRCSILSRRLAAAAPPSGFDVSRQKNQVRRSIGVVPQDFTLDRDMTGMENLTIQAALYDVPKEIASARMGELLKLVELQNVANRPVSTYSGGMQKRLELIMGLVHTPKVLFLDEPTLGLDAQTRLAIWKYIKMLNRDFRVTVFLTTHYLEEADELCNRILIIDGGKIRAEGTPEQLKDSLGGEIIELELSRIVDGSELKGIFASLHGVVNFSTRNTTCRVTTTKSESLAPKLILVLAAHGIEVESITVTKASLNQVFLKHTSSTMDSQEEEDQIRLLMREKMLRQRS
ncbi:MAG TPA: ATP-binding cassette domain-containing protein [Nitrososphaerales archaeon]|nr:ATP-binding cassette domain-containing protein [Nitrososphaerales archaeon]